MKKIIQQLKKAVGAIFIVLGLVPMFVHVMPVPFFLLGFIGLGMMGIAYFERLKAWYDKRRKERGKKGIYVAVPVLILYIAVAFLASIIVYVGWEYEQITSYGNSIKPVKSDVIIVLGTQVIGYQPSPALQERLDWALMLYHKHYAPAFILTGGQGQGERISEAEASQRYLESKGVPSAVIYLDNQSRNTWENLFDSKQIMQKHGMHTAIIVSNDFQQERAQLYARELGMHTSGYGGHSKYSYMNGPRLTLREVIAITLERH